MDTKARIQAVLDSPVPVAHVLFHRDRSYPMVLADPENINRIEAEALKAFEVYRQILEARLGKPSKRFMEEELQALTRAPDQAWASYYLQWNVRPDRYYVLYRACPDDPEVPVFIIFGVHTKDPQNWKDLDPWDFRWEGDPYAPGAPGL